MKAVEEVQIVIVGAGAAGLAAACRLLEKDFKDFVVVEASGRTGGRVHSIPFGRGTLDLGAEWVHGESGNVVYELASQYDLLYRSESPFEKSTLYRSDGKKFEEEVAQKLMGILDEIVDGYPDDIKKYNGSLGAFFNERYWPKVNSLIAEGKLSRSEAEDCLNWLEYVENSIDGSPSWFQTAANEAIEYVKCPGNVLNTWKLGGYGTVLDLLTKKIPKPNLALKINEKVRLGKEVTKINYDGPRVLVTSADGSQWSAERILITVSLNVLKAVSSELFLPALPPSHVNAIQGLGMGTVDKIFLEFPYRWWTPGTAGVSLVWRAEDAALVPKHLQWTTGVLGFYVEDNHPLNVMCGWIVGAHAEAMEVASDEEVIKECMILLRRFAGPDVEVPEAISMKRSRWHSNPYVRGSYTCRMVDSNKMNVWPKHLAEPVYNKHGKPVVLFAGEATHDHFFSTVHGAIETGWREADRIIAFNEKEIKSEVTIVGAGIAGLAAARVLTAAGLDVLLLEAQAKPGGRIHSVSTDWGWLELGAQWMHGEETELYQLASKRALLSDIRSAEGQGLYLRLDGSEVPNYLIKLAEDAVDEILKKCENYVGEKIYPSSVGAELEKKFSTFAKKSKSPEDEKILNELLKWHQRFQMIDNSCDDLRSLSAKSWGLYQDCGDAHCINFKTSFSSLIDSMVQDLPKGIIRYCTPVRKIEWNDKMHTPVKKPRAKVIADNLEVLTDHVIVTAPLGYLKEYKDSLFSPRLPEPISKAIELLGFGTITKLFLIYDVPWWRAGTKGFQFVWSDNSTLEAAVPWATGVTGFDVLQDRPGLLGWIGGPAASVVEALPESKIKLQATELLKRFTNIKDIPLPLFIYRSNWNSNNYIRGSYSHVTAACDREKVDCSSLAQPVFTEVKNGNPSNAPTILFAGEACHVSHYSTVHGAYESGQEQAQVVINYRGRSKAAKL